MTTVAATAHVDVTPLTPITPLTPLTPPKRSRPLVAPLTTAVALGCGALALGLVRAHGSGVPAGMVAGGLTALLGIWMVVLAVTPGLRHRTTVRTVAGRPDAALTAVAAKGVGQ
ncbi:hypothetical protein ACGFY7_07820 [Streptomyces prunicolor]|uniref:hypothetical protein n=1 Tax=Streptomyces prunicolor TaxID=67348 RepID=UPI0037224ED4